jgi:transcriptional/translational regulatory protein YebC/TACO1
MYGDCLTDNNNRTISDVRNGFTKTGAKLGVEGSVDHVFDHQAVFVFKVMIKMQCLKR